MKLDIRIGSYDQNVGNEISKANIANGITIERKFILRESVSAVIYSDFVFIIQNLAVPIAATLIANFLYDKLKRGKDNHLTINNQPIEINAEKIEHLIINIEKENKDK